MNYLYAGVDIGSKGFITLFDGIDYHFYSMPTKKVGSGHYNKNGSEKQKDVFNSKGFIDIYEDIKNKFPNHKIIVGVEDVGGRGGWSATANFSFGLYAGLQKFVFEMLDAEIVMIRPAVWQSHIRRGFARNGMDSKQFAEHIAITNFPNIDFRKTKRARNNDDNKIDSFLICRYIYEKFKKD